MFSPAPPPPATNNNAKKTERTFDGAKDARKEQGAGQYPNYHEQRTRSGHVFIMDDSNGNESVSLQHRTGSLLQFHPDGSVNLTAHNGQYSMIFGENRIVISGAQDVVVKGAASMMVEGDLNQTIRGDTNFTCDGDFNVNAKNMNMAIRGNIEMLGKTMTGKIEGGIALSAQGNMMLSSHGDAAFTSTGGSLALGASQDVGMVGYGSVYIQSDGKTHINAGSAINLEAASKISLQTSGTVGIDGTAAIHMNSGKSDSADKAAEKIQFKATVTPAKDTGDFPDAATGNYIA